MLCISMLGGALSCLTMGYLYEDLDSLREGLFWVVTGGFALSGVCFFLASFFYERVKKRLLEYH